MYLPTLNDQGKQAVKVLKRKIVRWKKQKNLEVKMQKDFFFLNQS